MHEPLSYIVIDSAIGRIAYDSIHAIRPIADILNRNIPK
jgi:hypothetical protein